MTTTFTQSGTIVSSSVPLLTRASIRTRLATFYGLDENDAQVLGVLNECIQTGYEKVVSFVNTHARQKELSFSTEINTREYSVAGLGIPTYVGYDSGRLNYLPYETLREKYGNFSSDYDVGNPAFYSLVGFEGDTKKVVIFPTPKEVKTVYILCFQVPPLLDDTTNTYPLVPPQWMWLVLERAKVERIRFERDMEAYQLQSQEFVAYMKVFLKNHYPAAPEPEAGFKLPPERENYNSWRGSRQ